MSAVSEWTIPVIVNGRTTGIKIQTEDLNFGNYCLWTIEACHYTVRGYSLDMALKTLIDVLENPTSWVGSTR